MGRFVREAPITVLTITPPEIKIDKSTGRANPDTQTERIVSGAIHPVPGEDLKKLGDGYRSMDVKVAFTHEQLTENDIVVYKGSNFRVTHEDDWDEPYAPLPHYKYILIKEVTRS